MIFVFHWKLRKGLGPEWEDKFSEVFLDDLPAETTFEEAKQIAIEEFKAERHRNGTTDREYIIKDIQTA